MATHQPSSSAFTSQTSRQAVSESLVAQNMVVHNVCERLRNSAKKCQQSPAELRSPLLHAVVPSQSCTTPANLSRIRVCLDMNAPLVAILAITMYLLTGSPCSRPMARIVFSTRIGGCASLLLNWMDSGGEIWVGIPVGCFEESTYRITKRSVLGMVSSVNMILSNLLRAISVKYFMACSLSLLIAKLDNLNGLWTIGRSELIELVRGVPGFKPLEKNPAGDLECDISLCDVVYTAVTYHSQGEDLHVQTLCGKSAPQMLCTVCCQYLPEKNLAPEEVVLNVSHSFRTSSDRLKPRSGLPQVLQTNLILNTWRHSSYGKSVSLRLCRKFAYSYYRDVTSEPILEIYVLNLDGYLVPVLGCSFEYLTNSIMYIMLLYLISYHDIMYIMLLYLIS
uniref:Uncharacterized protein n=1 Tax=Timema genevievae TaxID=629358 RepID=A0A7R9JYZ1_TIMGE|nr:unnamed protein product [Timema genevievae]